LDNSSEDNLYKRALILMEELKKKELPLEKKQQYLYFLIHIIGDAHQPLHVGREEDLGGNKVTLEWFGSKTNLHTIWDSKLIDFEKYSYSEYADVLNRVSKKEIKEIQKGSLENWIFDSYTLSNKIYSEVTKDDNLKYRYHYLNKDRTEEQLQKGGLRLSKVLNEIFKKKKQLLKVAFFIIYCCETFRHRPKNFCYLQQNRYFCSLKEQTLYSYLGLNYYGLHSEPSFLLY